MVLTVADLALAVYPLLCSGRLFVDKAKRAQLLHWMTWWYLWALLLFVDALSFGLLPLMDLIKGVVLLPNYSASCAALTARLLSTTRRHVASHPLCKALVKTWSAGQSRASHWWQQLQAEEQEPSASWWQPWTLFARKPMPEQS